MGESKALPSLITNTDVPLSNSLNPHWSHLVADRRDWLPQGQFPGVTMSNRECGQCWKSSEPLDH